MVRKIVCTTCLMVFGVWGCGGKAVNVDKCLSDLKSQDAVTRREAVIALGSLGSDGAVAVPALTRALSDPNDDIRVAVAQALGKIGPDAKAALPALEKALTDKYDRVQEAAAEAIKKVKGE